MIKPIISYFTSAKEELEKVSWPTREDVVRYSAIIIVATAALAIFFAAIDLGLHTAVSTVLTKRFQGTSQTTQDTTPQTQPTVDVTTSTVDVTPSTNDTNVLKK